MKLTNLFPQIKTDNKVQTKRTGSVAATTTASGTTLVGADRVDLSAGTQDVQKAQALLQQVPDVRADKVQALREKIDNGEYVVDPHQIADKMLFSLLSESVN